MHPRTSKPKAIRCFPSRPPFNILPCTQPIFIYLNQKVRANPAPSPPLPRQTLYSPLLLHEHLLMITNTRAHDKNIRGGQAALELPNHPPKRAPSSLKKKRGHSPWLTHPASARRHNMQRKGPLTSSSSSSCPWRPFRPPRRASWRRPSGQWCGPGCAPRASAGTRSPPSSRP